MFLMTSRGSMAPIGALDYMKMKNYKDLRDEIFAI
jgi:hypothetical protein